MEAEILKAWDEVDAERAESDYKRSNHYMPNPYDYAVFKAGQIQGVTDAVLPGNVKGIDD